MSTESPTLEMARCASCDAPNLADRETCWRCLRDLGADAEPPRAERESTTITLAPRVARPIELSPWPHTTPARSDRGRPLVVGAIVAILLVGLIGGALVNLLTTGSGGTDAGREPIDPALLAAAAGEPSSGPMAELTSEPATVASVGVVPSASAPPAAAEPEAAEPEAAELAASAPLAVAELEDDPATSAPEDRPAARGPRSANAFTCGSATDPVQDLRGRTWRVNKVSFRTMPGFERVILHLEQTGMARPGRGTQVIAGRVPTSEIADLPADVRPERARRGLLRIDLPGVPDGPELRAFRPLGLGNVGELSLLPGRGSRTALLAIDSEACYRIRVPAWGPTGADARRAEVVIDIRD